MSISREQYPSFWRNALTWTGSVTPKVIKMVVFFSGYSIFIKLVFEDVPSIFVDVGAFEVSGAVLSLLLVLRTNAAYDRWWEARKHWGGIVNQCRNLVISGLGYGPQEKEWKKSLVKWTAAFPYAAKRSLRKERELTELSLFLSQEEIRSILNVRHMPSFVAGQIAACIQSARVSKNLSEFTFIQMDRERTELINYIGACERILNAPIPLIIAIKVRRFTLLFLALVPFVLIQKFGWSTPLIMLLISYPLLALDQIGTELQNPFWEENLSHIKLDELCMNIEKDLFSLLETDLAQKSVNQFERRSITI